MPKEDTEIAHKVLQDNSHWAHSENILISMLADEREEVRRKAVLRIMKARLAMFSRIIYNNINKQDLTRLFEKYTNFRREFDEENHPRQFIPPKVNFQVRYQTFSNKFKLMTLFKSNQGRILFY